MHPPALRRCNTTSWLMRTRTKQVERAIVRLLTDLKAPDSTFQVLQAHPFEAHAILADFADTLKALKKHIKSFMQEAK